MPSLDAAPHDYWLPGYGLSRQIVLRQIQYHLGPTATVRPYSYHGREGYLINGRELTKEQIDDLKRQSKEYERQQTIRMAGRPIASTDSAEPDINEPIVVTINGRRSSPSYSAYSPYHRYR
ncbi:hypothetical protein LTS07_004958 [Exophiala sideris]|uniref:Uncharacterized protein n=1 Tax=Exophiala sideris TaxID=1016849 RepID=A0ABR0JCE5_9EURO|nr:hypothetical protein LTS07_004958 [Exophiala sideris]KAK5038944.1 hypothetical protein LTR13_003975 [Exophiala sideris]KAK5060828.1 hypothetical protein LTR69_005427 [Exophiala sideris]KAK5183740.1 hypothetical protein LTR44_004022 [Eurotiomycetes sp. CCFEE 6388]